MTDPGISKLNSPTTNVDNLKFHQRSRWHAWGGKQPPMTPARTRQLNAKKKFDRECIDVTHYASGLELARALAGGKVKLRSIAREHLAGRFPRAMHELSDRHLHVLELVAFVSYVWRRDGLTLPHDQLGELVGLKARRTGTIVRELVAWGYLLSHATFRPYGCVTSRRANAYELSPTARRCLDRRHGAQPGNDVSSSGVPANPETSCSQIREEHVALSGDCLAVPDEVSAPREARADEDRFCTVVVNESPLPSQPETRQAETRGTVGRLFKPEGADELVRDLAPYLELLAELNDRGGAS